MFSNNFGNFNTQSFNFQSIFKNSEISKPVQRHLSNVYTGLIFCILCAVVGVAADFYYQIGGGFFGIIGTFGMLLLLQIDPDKQNFYRRYVHFLCSIYVNESSISIIVSCCTKTYYKNGHSWSVWIL